MNRKLL